MVIVMYNLSDKQEIAERIRELRSAKNITQEKMAELVDVSYSTYMKIEHAGQNLTIKHLVNIARVLDVSTDLILFNHSENDEKLYSDLIETLQFESKMLDLKASIDDILNLRKE